MPVPLAAIAAGTFIVVAVIVAIIVAVAFSYYTYSGSAINAHPNDGLDGAPGAADPSEASGRSRMGDDPDDPRQSRRRSQQPRHPLRGPDRSGRVREPGPPARWRSVRAAPAQLRREHHTLRRRRPHSGAEP